MDLPITAPSQQMQLPVSSISVDTALTACSLPTLFYCCDLGFTTKAAFHAHVNTCQAHENHELRTDLAGHSGTLNPTTIMGNQDDGASSRSRAPCPRTMDLDQWKSIIPYDDKDKVVIVDGLAQTEVKLPMRWCELCSCGFSTEVNKEKHFDYSEPHRRAAQRLMEADKLPASPRANVCNDNTHDSQISNETFSDETAIQFRYNTSDTHKATNQPASIPGLSWATDKDDKNVETKRKLSGFRCEICNRDFVLNKQLQDHTRTSAKHRKKVLKLKPEASGTLEQPVGIERYVWCQVCHREFASVKQLTMQTSTSVKHKKKLLQRGLEASELPEQATEINPLTWCETCKREFRNAHDLSSHCRTSKVHLQRTVIIQLEKQEEHSKAVQQTNRFFKKARGKRYRESALSSTDDLIYMSEKYVSIDKTNGTYACKTRDRGFPDYDALEVHVRTAKTHGKRTRKRRNRVATLAEGDWEGKDADILTFRSIKVEDDEEKIIIKIEDVQEEGATRKSTRSDGQVSDNLGTAHQDAIQIHALREYTKLQLTPNESHIKAEDQDFLGGSPVNHLTRRYSTPYIALPRSDPTPDTIYQRNIEKPADRLTLSSTVRRVADLGGNEWSVVAESEYQSELAALEGNCHPPKELQSHGYPLRPYGPFDYAALRKCKTCGSKFYPFFRSGQMLINSSTRNFLKAREKCNFHPGAKVAGVKADGRLPRMIYSCCDTGALDQGCLSIDDHDFLPTDTSLVQKYKEYADKKRRAVVLHCENAGLLAPDEKKDEVTLFCVVDYLTGETLINSPVLPSHVTNWQNHYKGFLVVTMSQAIRDGTALYGARAARSKLWQYINSDTILIGHALKIDLHLLKIIHPKIVDSAMLVENATGSSKGLTPSFHSLYNRFLGHNFRNNKRKRDACLEYLMAKRELVHWCMMKPLKLALWGRVMKDEERREEEERGRKKLATPAYAILRTSHVQNSERRVKQLSDGKPETTCIDSQGRQEKEGIHSSKKLTNQDLEYTGTRANDTLEENASPRHKRMKQSPMINDNTAKIMTFSAGG